MFATVSQWPTAGMVQERAARTEPEDGQPDGLLDEPWREHIASVESPAVAGGAVMVYRMSTSSGRVADQPTLQTLVPPRPEDRAFAFYGRYASPFPRRGGDQPAA